MTLSNARAAATASRVRAAFAQAHTQGRATSIAYLTFGYPTVAQSMDVVLAAAAAGADVIELGVPFSDPSADGPSIARAMEHALEAGAGLPGALQLVEQIRKRGCEVPIVLFGYYNPIAVYGVDKFAARCAEVGVDAVLTVDLPVNELAELATPLASVGVGVIPLLAPTSTPTRFAKAAAFAPPFIYYISITGITGGGATVIDHQACAAAIAAIKSATSTPVALGFGIRNAVTAAAVAAYADGVIVGSWYVDEIARALKTGTDAPACVANAVQQVSDALRSK
jgi:tryptophan synthase alpha chain